MAIIQPSFSAGFARHAYESEAPEQGRGLVGNWAPFLGNQGGTLYDLSGYGWHVTLTNFTLSSAWGAGMRGPQLTWDGTNDYGELPGTSLFNFPNQSFSVSCWAKMGTLAANVYLINKRDTLGSPVGGWMVRVNATGTVEARVHSTTGSAAARTSVAILAVGVWSLVTVVFTTNTVSAAGNDVNIWINGVLSQGSLTADANVYSLSTVTPKIGVEADFVAATYINAAIDDMRVYDRGLTGAEILPIYNNPFARYRLRQRRARSAPAAAVALIAQERSIMRRVGGRVFGRVN